MAPPRSASALTSSTKHAWGTKHVRSHLRFLELLDISFRGDPTNHRPGINKLSSVKDQEQKKAGNVLFLDTDD